MVPLSCSRSYEGSLFAIPKSIVFCLAFRAHKLAPPSHLLFLFCFLVLLPRMQPLVWVDMSLCFKEKITDTSAFAWYTGKTPRMMDMFRKSSLTYSSHFFPFKFLLSYHPALYYLECVHSLLPYISYLTFFNILSS
jgi:hypothetical protein